MKISKIKISQNKLDNNFLFYLFLKEINSTNGLTEREIDNLLEKSTITTKYENIVEIFNSEIDNIKKDEKRENLKGLLAKITNEDIFNLFIFALNLIKFKPLLLAEAKIVSGWTIANKKGIHLLSLEYDTISKSSPYYTRVNGALLSLLFFDKLEHKKTNFCSKEAVASLEKLVLYYNKSKKFGVEPNQIFMLMFTESINQSIVSDAGGNYEDRILNILLSLGLKKDDICKRHDEDDKSTEYDFFFEINNKVFGISAKRTLRERYKQFIKTTLTTKIDVSIEITLGLDLNEEKAKTIRQHGTYIFVADEIYKSRTFLRNINGIYKASDLTIDVLNKIANNI